MGANSTIEWTTHTFNPWWGCVKVSPGCDHCYAEAGAKRYGFAVWGKDAPRRRFSEAYWLTPLTWDRDAGMSGTRARVFCGSYCDVMEDRLDLVGDRARLFGLIESTPNLDWLLLTKRPQNYRRLLPAEWVESPRLNVWLMTTVESPDYLWRIDALKGCPAVVHGLSIEPLLAPMPTLGEYLDGIEWLIAGSESGAGARPAEVDWYRSIRDQCAATGTPFFLKQFAERGRKIPTPLLDGEQFIQLPGVRL